MIHIPFRFVEKGRTEALVSETLRTGRATHVVFKLAALACLLAGLYAATGCRTSAENPLEALRGSWVHTDASDQTWGYRFAGTRSVEFSVDSLSTSLPIAAVGVQGNSVKVHLRDRKISQLTIERVGEDLRISSALHGPMLFRRL